MNKTIKKNSKQNLTKIVDNLLLERLPDYIHDELKWIRKEYDNDEISEFLFKEDDYYFKTSKLISHLNLIRID